MSEGDGACMQGLDDNLWYPMQHDEVVAQDTAAALEGLDLAATAVPSPGMPRAMSSDLDCPQAYELEDWQDYDPAEQTGPAFLVHACYSL
jgi:hypothetical protein